MMASRLPLASPSLHAFAALCAAWSAVAAEADLLASDHPLPEPLAMPPASERKAQAMAAFVQALLEEEAEGPEAAMETYRRSLELDPGNAALALRLSQDYLRRGDTVEAISVLKDALKARPQDSSLAVALALIYHRHLGKTELALEYARRALEASPAESLPYEALFEIYNASRQHKRLHALFQRAARQQPAEPSFWLDLAELAARAPKEAEANSFVSDFIQKAVDRASADGALLARAGDLRVMSGDLPGALKAYEMAYEAKASLPQLRQKLAACYAELGKPDDAIRILEEIVKLNPLDIEAYDQLARLHLQAGRLSQAAGYARQALLIEPRVLERHLQVADLEFRLQDFRAAANTLAEARRTFPSVARLAYFHALALGQLEQRAQALEAFRQAERLAMAADPGLLDANFYFDYGAAAERAGQYGLAAQMLQRSIRMDPDNAARARNYLGYMWADRNENLDEAETLIRQALEAEPDNGAYIDSLGWVLYRKGQFEEALDLLLRAAEKIEQPDPVIYDHIGDAYLALGKKTEAVLYWRKALALDSGNEQILRKLDEATAGEVVSKPSPPAASQP